MSKYTTELRYLVETQYPLGLDKYPIFEEPYRATLNEKIISHYMFREIGYETPGLFVNRLNERMGLIMPYYNQLYKSALLDFNPLLTTKMTDTSDTQKKDTSTRDTTEVNNQDTDQTTNGSTDTTADRNEGITDETAGKKTSSETGTNKEDSTDSKDRKEVGSDTPQGLLTMDDIKREIYATTASIGDEADTHTGKSDHSIDTTAETSGTYTRDTTGSENSHGTTTSKLTGTVSSNINGNVKEDSSSTESILKTLEGYQGTSGSELLLQFRETFLNIDLQLISELESLFMCIY